MCVQEHAKQINAAQQGKSTAQSQMARLDQDLQEALRQVAALRQALADCDTAHADAFQVQYSLLIRTLSFRTFSMKQKQMVIEFCSRIPE